ncbi:MAG: hypothetical protein IKA85_07075 [Clostridia bacterium]|nr:hypothetical protein [Clostridia bacterium]
MMNCFGFNNDNCCLYILIILLVLCLCGNGCLNGIIDKLCGCSWILPIVLLLLCCNNKGPQKPFSIGGCGCK